MYMLVFMYKRVPLHRKALAVRREGEGERERERGRETERKRGREGGGEGGREGGREGEREPCARAPPHTRHAQEVA